MCPCALELAPDGDRGGDGFGAAHRMDEVEAQSGSWFSQGHTVGNVGTRHCAVFSSHAFSGACCAHQPAVSCEGPGHRLFGSIVASPGSRLPCPPSLALLSFPSGFRIPWGGGGSGPQRALCAQAGTSPSSVCLGFSAPPDPRSEPRPWAGAGQALPSPLHTPQWAPCPSSGRSFMRVLTFHHLMAKVLVD